LAAGAPPPIQTTIPSDFDNFNIYVILTLLPMETISIITDASKHAGCGGLLGMSSEAPLYIIEHEGLETRIPGIEMVCLKCGERIRSQAQVEVVK
jgi:hypothetical protein